MRIEMLMRLAFLAFCGALAISGNATGQQPPKPPKQVVVGGYAKVQLASIEIIEVSPMAPTAGQVVTITYRITSTVLGNNPLTGNVTGTFQGQRLVELNGGPAPWVTLQPNESQTGQLLISSAGAGDGTLTVNFNRPLMACRGAQREGASGPCPPPLLATISTQLTVAQPTIHVRISGATYSNLSRPDSHDGSNPQPGYQCVVHNPGCGVWGNSGSDKYFNTKSLPPGAKLDRTDFVLLWPNGIDRGLAGGTGLGSGSFGASLSSNSGNIEVNWNNTCWSAFGGKDVYYSISFLVSMPKGTDLGEPSFDAASLMTSPCRLDGYGQDQKNVPPVVSPSGWVGQVLYCNPTTQGETLYLHLRAKLVKADPGAEGDASPMVEDNLPLQFSQGGSSGSQSEFRTAQKKYQQGNWQITDAYITLSQTSSPSGTVKHSSLSPLPVNAQLPGAAGSPVLDFRGGSCL